MDRKQVVFVRGTLRRGAFPHERAFVITFPDGSEYRGIVPATYCLDFNGVPIGDAPKAGSEVEGRIVGLLFARNQDGTYKVELPDGNVYELRDDQYVVSKAPSDVFV